MPKSSGDRGAIAPELSALLTGSPTERVSVLIEADVPSPRASLAGPARRGRDVTGIRPLSAAQSRERDQRIEDLRRLLVDVSGAEPRYFKYSNAFGVTLTATQLKKVARSPLVRAVRENRRLAARG